MKVAVNSSVRVFEASTAYLNARVLGLIRGSLAFKIS